MYNKKNKYINSLSPITHTLLHTLPDQLPQIPPRQQGVLKLNIENLADSFKGLGSRIYAKFTALHYDYMRRNQELANSICGIKTPGFKQLSNRDPDDVFFTTIFSQNAPSTSSDTYQKTEHAKKLLAFAKGINTNDKTGFPQHSPVSTLPYDLFESISTHVRSLDRDRIQRVLDSLAITVATTLDKIKASPNSRLRQD